MHIASAQAYKYGGRAGISAFALQRVKNFVDAIFLIHNRMVLARSVALVRGDVAFAFLNIDAVAVGHVVAYPAGNIFGCGVEGQHFVEVGVVQSVHHRAFDVRKVGDHAVGVQLGRTAVHGDYPIVPVCIGAFAVVGQRQAVSRRYFESFCEIIHCLLDGVVM